MTQLEALKAIAARDNGLLRPKAVVDAARPEDSPLHKEFEWDDGVAAEKYRLEQAQQLIRSFRVVIDDSPKPISVPVFIGVSTDRTGSSADNPYRLLEDVKKRPDLLAQAEEDALEQLKGFRNRYGHLKRLNKIWNAIDAMTDS